MVSHRIHHRLLVSLLAATIAAGAPAVVTAQQSSEEAGEETGTVDPSNEQLELNSQAVSAIQSGDYEKAITLLEASNALGQMNVTWLNLGRAYQKLGKCAEARSAYLSVISAPAVPDPSPRLINAKADQYLGELDAECEVAEEDKAEMAAADEQEKDPAEAGEDARKHTEVAEPAEPVEPVEPVEQESDALGWSLTASGLVIAGAGVGAHFWAESIRDEVTTAIGGADAKVVTTMNRNEALEKESRANTLDTVGVSAIAVGALVTGAGVYLLLTDDVEAAPSASIAPGGGVSVGVSGKF